MPELPTSRGRFLKNLALAGTGIAALSSCSERAVKEEGSSPALITQKKIRWNMVTTWPPNFPILGEACNLLADWVEELSGGRFRINVYGGGELIPALEAFDAVRSGTAQLANGASYYWAGKHPATQFFAAIPFGMNARALQAWLFSGGGIELWEELYAEFNMIPFPAGNTGEQMAGWFNKEINSMDDLKGLKMRIPGLGGKVLSKAGGAAVLSPGSEIYTNLERGVIDATEWIGPYHDYIMGFHEISRYYYAPGWHEPGSILECFVNKTKFESLPTDLQAILRYAINKQNQWVLQRFDYMNALYLKKMKEEGVDIRMLPKEVLNELKDLSEAVVSEEASKDPFAKRVWESYSEFKRDIGQWMNYSERAYYDLINP